MLAVDGNSSLLSMDRLLKPVHRWIWGNPERRVQNLLRFSETETNGGRDLLRAAELTADPLLRRLYLVHAADEQRHGVLFHRRAAALLHATKTLRTPRPGPEWLPAGDHCLDDVHLRPEP